MRLRIIGGRLDCRREGCRGTGEVVPLPQDQAEAQRIKAAEAAVGRAMILIETGQAHARDGQRAEALASFRQATITCPELSEAHYQLGLALVESRGDAAAAEAAFDRAIDLHPARADGFYHKGQLRATHGDRRGAVDAFARAAMLKPSLIDAHRALAEIALQQHDWAAALAELDTVLAWEPDNVRARDQRAMAIDAQAREAARR